MLNREDNYPQDNDRVYEVKEGRFVDSYRILKLNKLLALSQI